MAWGGNYQERRRSWEQDRDALGKLPGWTLQLFASLFIFFLILGAAKGESGLSKDMFAFAKDVVEKDITYEEVKAWVIGIPDTVRKIAGLDLRDFWIKGASGQPIQLAWPVQGEVTSFFGWRPNPDSPGMSLHQGIDIQVPEGTRVVAALDGIVTSVRESPSYGLVVEIEHPNGFSTVYAHLQSVFVKKDQKVKKGEAIGTAGQSGNATAPHLHFELKKDGLEIDPMTILPPRVKGP
ncbi:MAG TPA: M23 family metallopeptidase [Firmicutes bacterium]|nr:M23 family metallopeptidase [Candidatus Fermentithermobacillaceae bacterium]